MSAVRCSYRESFGGIEPHRSARPTMRGHGATRSACERDSPVRIVFANESRAVVSLGEVFVPNNVPEERHVVAHSLDYVLWNTKAAAAPAAAASKQQGYNDAVVTAQWDAVNNNNNNNGPHQAWRSTT